MPIFQSYNRKIGAYVKGHVMKHKNGKTYFKVKDVKQRLPNKPFKGVPIRRKR